MKWYEYNTKERYDNVYLKHTLKDFFEWWHDANDFMELRFDSWQVANEVSKTFKCYKNLNSVFINNFKLLEQIVLRFRTKSHIWFGINPRRPLRNQFGKFAFSGKDVNVSKLKYLFVDIDRVVKEGPATNKDLMNADFLCTKLIEELNKENFAKSYIKICSGNGVQILFKLDKPFEMPVPKLNEEGNVYIESYEFNLIKNKIKDGVGKILPNFSEQFKKDYNVEIDKSCFNLGRIGAMPLSLNLKYEKPVPRGIIEIKYGINEGLSDYVETMFKDSKKRVSTKNEYSKINVAITKEYELKLSELEQNVIVNLMLNYQFPNGGINNTLWYALKILFHRQGITKDCPEYVTIHNKFKALHGRTFTDNGLEPEYKNNFNGYIKEKDINFVPFTVNRYLRLNKIFHIKSEKTAFHKPLFPVSPLGKTKHPTKIFITPRIFNYDKQKMDFGFEFKMSEQMEDPLIDVQEFAKQITSIRRGDFIDSKFKQGDFKYDDLGKIFVEEQLHKTFINFAIDFRCKWKDDITLYMMKHYFEDYFNHIRFY